MSVHTAPLSSLYVPLNLVMMKMTMIWGSTQTTWWRWTEWWREADVNICHSSLRRFVLHRLGYSAEKEDNCLLLHWLWTSTLEEARFSRYLRLLARRHRWDMSTIYAPLAFLKTKKMKIKVFSLNKAILYRLTNHDLGKYLHCYFCY